MTIDGLEGKVEKEELPKVESEEIKEERPKVGDEDYTNAVRKRIDKVTREKHEALREKDKLQKELVELKSKFLTIERPVRPSEDNFRDSYGDLDRKLHEQAVSEYEDKLLEWNDRKRDINSQKQTASTPNIPEQVPDEHLSQFVEQCDKARQKYKNFDAIAEKPIFTEALKKAIIESELGAEMLFYLGNNDDYTKKIGILPENTMMKEIGRLEGKIIASQNKTSSAPGPINPIVGGDVPRKDRTKMSADEYYDAKKAGLIKDD